MNFYMHLHNIYCGYMGFGSIYITKSLVLSNASKFFRIVLVIRKLREHIDLASSQKGEMRPFGWLANQYFPVLNLGVLQRSRVGV